MFLYNNFMKFNVLFLMFLFSINLFSTDFEIEIMSAGDGSETKIFKFSDNITYRHFYSHQNWKDNLGDWGTLECAGNHTIIKNKGTILKNYCKGINKDGDLFWLMMDRNSVDFDAGLGTLKYKKGTGKFKNHEGTECIYAINFLKHGNGTFQKAKCKYNK